MALHLGSDKVFEQYEKKSGEVKSDPFVLEEKGKQLIMSQLKVDHREQKKQGYSDEKVKKILGKSMDEHCFEIGYTYDQEPIYHKNPLNDWTITAFLKPSLFRKWGGLKSKELQLNTKEILTRNNAKNT